MLDTALFREDFKYKLLSCFNDLEIASNGLMIQGENYQAIQLLIPRYNGQVQCVYIDPPYNSKTSEILYKNTFKHSSWASLMANRLELSGLLSSPKGSHVIAIDENEQELLGFILNDLYPNHKRVCVSVIHNKKGIQGDFFSYTHEFAYFCIPPELGSINEKALPENEWEYDNLRNWGIEL